MAVVGVVALLGALTAAGGASASPSGESGPAAVPPTVEIPAAAASAIARNGRTRLLVSSDDPARLRGELPNGSFTVDRELQDGMVAITVDGRGLAALGRARHVRTVAVDELNRATLAESVPRIEAPAVWTAGYTGAGQTIVIVDTGVDASHPFLGGRVVDGACFSTTNVSLHATSQCPGGVASATGVASAGPCSLFPDCDHGTHVAGIAAGGTGASGSGVAWGANIISIQVFSLISSSFDCGGPSFCVGAFTSDVLAALDYVDATLRLTRTIPAVNLSLGAGLYSGACDTDTRKARIDSLRSHGIATVVAAGNDGSRSKMAAPACISTVISVSATADDADVVAGYADLDNLTTLLAPGSNITSSISGGGTATYSGTSMAAPHVVGTLALIRQALPNALIGNLIASLQATGVSVTTSGITKSRISAIKALDALRNPPTITSLNLAVGPTNGTEGTTITGLGFYGVTSVKFGTTAAASFTVTNFTTIQALEPVHAAGAVNITVTNAHGTSTTSAASVFTFVAPPVITAVTPNNGSGAGGNTITLTGARFTGARNVTVGGLPATSFAVQSDTSMTVVVPTHAAGTVHILVTATGGTSTASASDQYTYNPPSFTITNTPPPGLTGVPYQFSFTWSGSPSPTFSMTGTWPAGWTMTSDGVVTGTPGTSTVLFKVTAANGIDSVTKLYGITVSPFAFTVNSTTDAPDASVGDHVCATAGGVCSLRAAIQEVDAVPSASATIDLASNATYALSVAGADEDAAMTGDLDINSQVQINGNGSTINANGFDRVFDVRGGTLVVPNTTVRGGYVSGNGGGIRVAASASLVCSCTITANTATGDGGGIDLAAGSTLQVCSCTIAGNTALGNGGGMFTSVAANLADATVSNNVAGNAGGGVAGDATSTITGPRTVTGNHASFGGGVASLGPITVTDATITGNSAGGIGGGGLVGVTQLTVLRTTISGNTANQYGGGVLAFGTVTITSSTIAGNQALRGGGLALDGTATLQADAIVNNSVGAGDLGGGIFNAATLHLRTSTVSGNVAPIGGGVFNAGAAYGWAAQLDVVDSTIATNGGGGLTNDSGATASVTNSIFAAEASGSDCGGSVASGGYNLAYDASCAFAATGDVLSTDASLAPLAAGSGTWYHLPLAGSPAIGTGKPGCSGKDQRGTNRPQGACDRGAIEV